MIASPPYPAPFDHPEAHRFRIGLAPIPIADWFEGPIAGDGDPAARKAAVFAAEPAVCWGETEGSRAGQSETLALIAAHFGRAPVETVETPPLRQAAALVDDDLCLMEWRSGEWVLTAASLCAPSFFTAREAVGKPMKDLHAPVAGFAQTMAVRVARMFDALADGVILERRNWTVTTTGDLFTPQAAPVRARLPLILPQNAGTSLFLRMERQTLRRLPQTGGLIFTIRIWRHPLATLADEPARLAAFAASWDRIMGDTGAEFRTYKGLEPFDPLVRAFLTRAGA